MLCRHTGSTRALSAKDCRPTHFPIRTAKPRGKTLGRALTSIGASNSGSSMTSLTGIRSGHERFAPFDPGLFTQSLQTAHQFVNQTRIRVNVMPGHQPGFRKFALRKPEKFVAERQTGIGKPGEIQFDPALRTAAQRRDDAFGLVFGFQRLGKRLGEPDQRNR